MGRCNKKIFKITLFSLSLAICGTVLADGASQLQDAELKTFMVPKYNLETKKLEYILTGKDAETVGTLVKIVDAKLEVLGKDGKSIDIVITTPEAFYDRVADTVKGDKDVHYRSLQMDADGVGFNVSNLNKTIHIEKDVKMWIYQKGRGKQSEVAHKKSEKKEADKKESKKSGTIDLTDEADSAVVDNSKIKQSETAVSSKEKEETTSPIDKNAKEEDLINSNDESERSSGSGKTDDVKANSKKDTAAATESVDNKPEASEPADVAETTEVDHGKGRPDEDIPSEKDKKKDSIALDKSANESGLTELKDKPGDLSDNNESEQLLNPVVSPKDNKYTPSLERNDKKSEADDYWLDTNDFSNR